MTRDDPELGPVRLCHGCGEEWPTDVEFWVMRDGKLHNKRPVRCRACWAEFYAKRWRARQQIIRNARVLEPPTEGRCNRFMATVRDYCGRRPDHDYQCRSRRAMLNDAQRPKVRRHPERIAA